MLIIALGVSYWGNFGMTVMLFPKTGLVRFSNLSLFSRPVLRRA